MYVCCCFCIIKTMVFMVYGFYFVIVLDSNSLYKDKISFLLQYVTWGGFMIPFMILLKKTKKIKQIKRVLSFIINK